MNRKPISKRYPHSKHYNQNFSNTLVKTGKFPEYFSYWLIGFIEAEGSFRYTLLKDWLNMIVFMLHRLR